MFSAKKYFHQYKICKLIVQAVENTQIRLVQIKNNDK